MGIPEPTVFNKTKGVSEPYKNLSECEARLDKIMKYFDGDVSEIRNILKSLPENKVKVTLIKSTIAAGPKNNKTIAALGLSKLYKTVELPDNAATQGALRKVAPYVKVEEV